MTLALCAVLGDSALAQSHEIAMHHHGVPSRFVAGQRVGPYVASVWIEREVGDGMVYVMLEAADGRVFTPPSAVRVTLVPVSGRLGEVVREAHPETLRGVSSARYVTEVPFDRPELWNLRVTVEGSAGGGEIVSQVESTSNAALGPLGVFLGSIPFVLVGFVYWRSSLTRRRKTTASVPLNA